MLIGAAALPLKCFMPMRRSPDPLARDLAGSHGVVAAASYRTACRQGRFQRAISHTASRWAAIDRISASVLPLISKTVSTLPDLHCDYGHNADTALFAKVFCCAKILILLARPKRFELLTPRFVVWCSIQLSYGRLASRQNGRQSGLRCA